MDYGHVTSELFAINSEKVKSLLYINIRSIEKNKETGGKGDGGTGENECNLRLERTIK